MKGKQCSENLYIRYTRTNSQKHENSAWWWWTGYELFFWNDSIATQSFLKHKVQCIILILHVCLRDGWPQQFHNILKIFALKGYNLNPVYNLDNVGNKAKGRISKWVFQENKARQIFRKRNISHPLIRTRTYKEVRNVCFLGNLAALFSWNTRFEIRLFALSPTIMQIKEPFGLITKVLIRSF